jgi:CRISPR-associated protein Cmr2
MTYLAQITFGPVQGFIATARRSRDLWFGSLVLSQISRAAARSLHDGHAKRLVFPYVSQAGDPDALIKKLNDNRFLVTNIVVSELRMAQAQARQALEDAKAAATTEWSSICRAALQLLPGNNKGKWIDEALWTVQLEDVVEVYFGAVPIDTTYASASEALRELMANRKNSRLFGAYHDKERRQKSSLDGAQSTVLVDALVTGTGSHARRRRRIGIERNEQLDTAATVKRLLGSGKNFLPAARVAAQEWVARVKATSASELAAIADELTALSKLDIGTQFGGGYDAYEWVKPLPFDGQLLFRNRVAVEVASIESEGISKSADFQFDADEIDEANKRLKGLDKKLAALAKQHGAPQPYYGLLLADGDRMGQLLDAASKQADGIERHRAISAALSRFAQSVPELMSQLEGACIYSGGDDVLGLVPVHRAVEIADKLRTAFAQALADVADGIVDAGQKPTLSVGVALVHFLEPLGDARDLAAKAEKIAKGGMLAASLQRNALCLLAKPRGGVEIELRVGWDDAAALKRLTDWQRWLRPASGGANLPKGLPHELADALNACNRLQAASADPKAVFGSIWPLQVRAVLSKKRPDGELIPEHCKSDLQQALVENPQEASQALLMARWLAGVADAGSLNGDEP